MIQGTEYSWEDIQIVFPGKATPITGVTAIDYETKKEHVNIYGRGDKPVAVARGKKEFSGSISLNQSEIEALQRAIPPGKSLTDIAPFNVTVAFAPEGGILTTDQLLYCRIGSIKKGMKTGDTSMEVTLPLVIGDIKYNI